MQEERHASSPRVPGPVSASAHVLYMDKLFGRGVKFRPLHPLSRPSVQHNGRRAQPSASALGNVMLIRRCSQQIEMRPIAAVQPLPSESPRVSGSAESSVVTVWSLCADRILTCSTQRDPGRDEPTMEVRSLLQSPERWVVLMTVTASKRLWRMSHGSSYLKAWPHTTTQHSSAGSPAWTTF